MTLDGSVAGHWLFSRRRWLNPANDDDRQHLEQGYCRLCIMLPPFRTCLLSSFLHVLARTAESWARRASECWSNRKIVVLIPRPDPAESIADRFCNRGAACTPKPLSGRGRMADPEEDAASCTSHQGQDPPAGRLADRDAAAILHALAWRDAGGSAGHARSDLGDDAADSDGVDSEADGDSSHSDVEGSSTDWAAMVVEDTRQGPPWVRLGLALRP
jgi:hypothetical protein